MGANLRCINMEQTLRANLLTKLGMCGVNGEFTGATEAQVQDAELKLNARLPDDYKAFVKDFGASLFTKDVTFKSKEPSPWAVGGNECIDVLYGIHGDAGFDLCRVNSRLEGAIPEGTIAIGHDSGSNLILLCPVSSKVRFFDKESGATFLIADTFDDFLHSFRPR